MTHIAKSVIESLGVYLPNRKVTTSEIIEGCVNRVRVPLERLTGIRSRHFAGDTEFSIDLAYEAVEDCLKRSNTKASEFDLLICANISRYDGPRRVTYEPSTSMTLKRHFGFDRAIAMDLSNACAGMWTAVYIVDALIRSGAIRHGMVVSGEFISYLAETAQKEIKDYLDPQLASLTLGDAGVAVAMQRSNRPEIGFHDIELYTLSKYSRDCIAKPTAEKHGGAAMHTDAVNVAAAVVPNAAAHAEQLLVRNGQSLQQVNHIIPHQTSRLTMQDALKEIEGRFDTDFSGQLINNLAERGNTASTSHFLALRDSILEDRIRSGDNVLFSISGSGQTTGTALYTCDSLPDRMRANGSAKPAAKPDYSKDDWGNTLPVRFQIESIGLCEPRHGQEPDTLPMLSEAALNCLEGSVYEKHEIELLLSVGVYRNEFLTEPAIAALLCGDLEINHARKPSDQFKTLAFDILNGSIGFLNACYVANELGRAGCIERSMIAASEIENNANIMPQSLLGLKEMGSAMILHESEDGETGFCDFAFYHFPDFYDASEIYGTWTDLGQPYMAIKRDDRLHDMYLDCVELGVAKFLKENELAVEDIKLFLPPQISHEFVRKSGERVGVDEARIVNAAPESLDLATSSTPCAMKKVFDEKLANSGDLGLIVNVGSGIQIACATYQF